MSTINELSAVATVSGGDLIPVFSTSNGDARKCSFTVAAAYVGQNLGAALATSLTTSSYLKSTATTVAALPAAATVGAGARSTVTDANAATFNSVVAAGGANTVPVHCDGTNWRIG